MHTIKTKKGTICNPRTIQDLEKVKAVKDINLIIDIKEINDIESQYYFSSIQAMLNGLLVNLEREFKKNIIIWDDDGFTGGVCNYIAKSN